MGVNIKPSAEIRKKYNEIPQICKETGKPVYIYFFSTSYSLTKFLGQDELFHRKKQEDDSSHFMVVHEKQHNLNRLCCFLNYVFI